MIHYVPLLVKISAINDLAASGKHMQRVRVQRRVLCFYVTAGVALVAIFVLVWNIMDPPEEIFTYSMTDLKTSDGESIIAYEKACGSESNIWQLLSFAWRAALVVPGCLLAFFALRVREDMNDTKLVSSVLFIHLFFLIVMAVWYPQARKKSQSEVVGLGSLLLSAETIITLGVYVLPKFLCTSGEHVDNEPLPDVFVHTTISLIDVDGFTAWASVRQPVQVFKFLQQLYEQIDQLGDKYSVTKIETVGECYGKH